MSEINNKQILAVVIILASVLMISDYFGFDITGAALFEDSKFKVGKARLPEFPGWNYCTPSRPCPVGVGDCDVSEDCQSGACVSNTGGEYYGPRYKTVDVCENMGGRKMDASGYRGISDDPGKQTIRETPIGGIKSIEEAGVQRPSSPPEIRSVSCQRKDGSAGRCGAHINAKTGTCLCYKA